MTTFSPHTTSTGCTQCRDFGGWLPVRVGDEVQFDVHSRCDRPNAPVVVAQPESGCAYWVERSVADF